MFKEKGWTVPTTWDEMIKLSDTIAGTGMKPWCAGFESGVATGWPGTDWIEDLMLRTTTTDNYDKWTTHGIPFNDPAVVAAFDKAGEILKNDKYVNGGIGGVKTIATTAFQDGGKPIELGKCAMHRQASFYSGTWKAGSDISETGDIFAFYLPAVDPAKGKPVLGGGEVDAMFNDKPETVAVLSYFTSAQGVKDRAAVGDWIGPNKAMTPEMAINWKDKKPNTILALSIKILNDPAAVFRFDGSDLMPSAVGAGTFWKGMTKWVSGADTKSVTDDIEASWPKS
jgi:alpha-glucoside transport system substrate-binding protein